VDGVAIRDARFGGSAGVVMGRLRHGALIDQSTFRFRVLGGMRFSHFAHAPIDGGVSGESRFPIGADAEALPFFQSRLALSSFSASAFHATPTPRPSRFGSPHRCSGCELRTPSYIHTGESQSWGMGEDGICSVFLPGTCVRVFARPGASVPCPI
jgi:hypothetical protein